MTFPAEPDLFPSMERAIALPHGADSSGQWRVGGLFAATVRIQNGEMLFSIGDQFFTTRPIPGLGDNARIALQVARNAAGDLVLLPLLPLAGTALHRIGGTAVANFPQAVDTPLLAPAATALFGPIRTLGNRLTAPGSLIRWMQSQDFAGLPMLAGVSVESPSEQDSDIGNWMRSIAMALSNSGLFYESRLRGRATVPGTDIKRQLLNSINQSGSDDSDEAWSALDDVVRMQSAASLAEQVGGTCYSFVVPAPDAAGAWWITLQREAPEHSPHRPARQESGTGWHIRLQGVQLPIGQLDIRIRQTGDTSVGLTLLTGSSDLAASLEAGKSQLVSLLDKAGLQLSSWAVIDQRPADEPTTTGVGRFSEIRV